jgi:sulfoxide reductase heme-binding subunit YedZ
MPSAIDLSSFAGLTAMVLMTVNMLLGLLVTTNVHVPRKFLPRHVPLFKIHNWTAYVAISIALLHPTILLFSGSPKFQVLDLVWPLHSPGQSNYNLLGAITLYLFLFVVITSYFRPKMGYRPWKKLHYVAYAAGMVMFIHGTLIDPNIKNQPPDFLDGEKVLVEGCFLLVVAAAIWRVRYGKEKQRYYLLKKKAEKAA